MEKILIIGSSGHAKVIIDLLERQALFSIFGLIDSFRKIGDEVLGYKILGSEFDLPNLVKKNHIDGLFVAIGDNSVRSKVVSNAAKLCPELPFVTAIHPDASVGRDVVLGAGVVIMAGAIVNTGCRIGPFCIVNTRASLDHDSVMDEFASLAPGVTTGGNCRIGAYAAVGIGAALCHGAAIGEHSVVGGGAFVQKNVDAYTVAYGVPAKKGRDRQRGDTYL